MKLNKQPKSAIGHIMHIAQQALQMPDAMVMILGGMTKAETREMLKQYNNKQR